MPNFELIPVQIPNDQPEVEKVEQWLETCAKQNVTLVCFMPTQTTDIVLAVMTTVQERGQVPPPPGRWRRF